MEATARVAMHAHLARPALNSVDRELAVAVGVELLERLGARAASFIAAFSARRACRPCSGRTWRSSRRAPLGELRLEVGLHRRFSPSSSLPSLLASYFCSDLRAARATVEPFGCGDTDAGERSTQSERDRELLGEHVVSSCVSPIASGVPLANSPKPDGDRAERRCGIRRSGNACGIRSRGCDSPNVAGVSRRYLATVVIAKRCLRRNQGGSHVGSVSSRRLGHVPDRDRRSLILVMCALRFACGPARERLPVVLWLGALVGLTSTLGFVVGCHQDAALCRPAAGERLVRRRAASASASRRTTSASGSACASSRRSAWSSDTRAGRRRARSSSIRSGPR